MKDYKDSNLYKIRHSAAHVLAMAVLEIDPDAKLAIGPPIENGFYYDFELTNPLSEKDFVTLEKSMNRIIKANYPIKHKLLDRQAAISLVEKAAQPYKLELIEDLNEEQYGFYGINDFWDLCKGPHVTSTSEIKAFKLLSVAGAYWRGSENNPMLTRIYGTAFEHSEELDAYLNQMEEAKKRDHRKLGVQLDLYTFSELVGSGLPLWTPKGNAIRERLDDFIWQLREKYGYQKVEIPHIAKKALYETSGHWEKFKDELFKIESRDGHTYALKPMNCPHHTQIFKRKLWSYRELPQRYANTTMVYRDEQSGELSGLSRVISITQDDAHVFCRSTQVRQEIESIWNIIKEFNGAFGFTDLQVRLSFRDPKKPDDYIGSTLLWEQAESELKEIAKKRKANAVISEGDATFYGPKIDFMAKDSLGRDWQIATIQLDMNMPKRFDLTFINEDGKPENVVMIHAAIAGSLERYISILLEHFGGALPFWLAPVQIKILPISEKVSQYAQSVANELNKLGYRVELDDGSETLGKRIRQAEMDKVPYCLILGQKEEQDKSVTIRSRQTAKQETLPLEKFVKSIAIENHP